MQPTDHDETSDHRASMNYIPASEVWNFSNTSIVSFKSTTKTVDKCAIPSLNVECYTGLRRGNTTVIDQRVPSVNIQLDTLELMDLASFLVGARISVAFMRGDKYVRMVRQQHSPHEYKIYLTAQLDKKSPGIGMGLLPSRVSCITALVLTRLHQVHNGLLPPELLLASVRNFQLATFTERTMGEIHAPKSPPIQTPPPRTTPATDYENDLARRPPRPRPLKNPGEHE